MVSANGRWAGFACLDESNSSERPEVGNGVEISLLTTPTLFFCSVRYHIGLADERHVNQSYIEQIGMVLFTSAFTHSLLSWLI